MAYVELHARSAFSFLRGASLPEELAEKAAQLELSALAVCDRVWIPVRRSWRLNERHYGALQGKNKRDTAEEYGREQVNIWRRSYATPPPPLDWDDPTHPRFDPRYASLPADVLPASECLADVVDRMLPYWYDGIAPDLKADAVVLVAAHGNSLRGLVKHLDKLSDDAVVGLNIGTGQPLVYELGPRLEVISSRYLDPDAAARAASVVAHQAG